MRVVCFRCFGKYGHFLRAEANANGITYPFPPRTVLLGHGDEDSRQWFEEQIRLRHPKIKVIQPAPGKVVEV